MDPNGSQYDSGNDEFPLDAFNEFIEVEESDTDSDIVYICSTPEMSPSQTKDLISLADIGSISKDPSMTETEVVSIVNPVVPRDLSPQELLLILPEDKHLKIYYQRKDEEDPNWVPQYVSFPTQRYWPRAPDRLLSLGYLWDDKIKDSDYIQRVAQTDPEGFQELTGYRMPSHIDHITFRICGECTPEIRELIFMDNDGTAYTCTIYNCQTNTLTVSIPAMEDIKDTPRQYRYRLVKPTGTVARPEREDGEDLCLTGYVTINRVKGYTLFDSGSMADAVSPDFARVSNVPILRLVKPATLQLGCLGSRLKINFATIAVVGFGSTTAKNYLDIANIDKYDCILGTLF